MRHLSKQERMPLQGMFPLAMTSLVISTILRAVF